MEHVVESGALPWIQTPDQALVWGVALGLQHDVEAVLRRSLEDASPGTAAGPWFPGWYVGVAAGASPGGGAGGGF